MKKLLWRGGVLLAIVGGALACGTGATTGPERVAATSQAINKCSPACTAAWSDCQEVTVKNTPLYTCLACGGLGEAPCDASGPDQGCQLQSGQTSVSMGSLNGVCAACGDINQPACDSGWNPPNPSGTGTFWKGCSMQSQMVASVSPQPLQLSNGMCEPCANGSQPACDYLLFTPVCSPPFSVTSTNTCMGCGAPGSPQCSEASCAGNVDPNMLPWCSPTTFCADGLVNASGTCEDNYGQYAPFAPAVIPNQANQIVVNPRIVTIVAANDTPEPNGDGTDTAANLEAFAPAMAQSQMWAAVTAEYELGTLTAGPSVDGPALLPSDTTTGLTQTDLQSYIATLVKSTPSIAPDGKTVYLVFIPPTLALASGNWTDCGFHIAYTSEPSSSYLDSVAIVRRCQQANESWLDTMTDTASHEIVETITNPHGKGYVVDAPHGLVTLYNGIAEPLPMWMGWDNNNAGAVTEGVTPGPELGDFCEGTRRIETIAGQSWELQRIFSNKAALAGGDPCIPAVSDPYFTVSTPQQWYGIQPGQTIEIPLTGWSTAAVQADWFLNAQVRSTAPAPPAPIAQLSVGALTSPLGTGHGYGTGCHIHPTMNNGVTATLSVSAPANACAGDFVTLDVWSFEEDDPTVSCNPPLTKDQQHRWPIGVYLQGGSCACAGQPGWPTAAQCQ